MPCNGTTRALADFVAGVRYASPPEVARQVLTPDHVVKLREFVEELERQDLGALEGLLRGPVAIDAVNGAGSR